MPTLYYSSPLLETAADGLSLVLGVTHQLKLATGDHPVLKLPKFPPSELLDVLSSASIVLRLTGSFQGKEIRIETLRQSSLVVYLLECLKFHASQLFIGSISDPYVGADGSLELTIVSSRALLDPDELPVTTATLIAINWSFAWKSNSAEDPFMHPFSPQHLLPVQNMVYPVVEKALSRDFVRHYPIIFGSWRNFLCAEMDAFPQVVQPILSIIARSQNPAFQKQCRKLLRSLRRRNDTIYDNSLDGLQNALGSLILDDIPVCQHWDDERVLLASLQRVHRTSFRAEPFRTSVFSDRSDHCMTSSDTLFEYEVPSPFVDPSDPPPDSDEPAFMDLFTESKSFKDTEDVDMRTFETPGSKGTIDTGCYFGADDDALALVGLDSDLETISLQPSLTQKRDDSPLDNDPDCMVLDLDASSTEFPWRASTRSDAPCFYNLSSAASDQFMLDLDSDDEEIAEGETVLDF